MFDPPSLNILAEYARERLITTRPHQELPLLIHNYTPECQYGFLWDEITLQARGLVTTDTGKLVARGPRKFFNAAEHLIPERNLPQIPDAPAFITPKMDGSLILAFNFEGDTILSTRGSFHSLQAEWAREFWKYDVSLPEGYTYCFEAIYPENRIVIDYGGREDLVLLCVLDLDGRVDRQLFDAWQGSKVWIRNGDPAQIIATTAAEEGYEGYVLRYENGLWVKVKTDWYMRIHKVLSGLTPRSVWESMRFGNLHEIYEIVPDEFYDEVAEIEVDLKSQYQRILDASRFMMTSLEGLDRKSQAQALREFDYSGIVFGLLDGKDVSDRIWKLIKPPAVL